MRVDLPNLDPHADTLAAVVVGALLATISGILANQLEAYLRRRERERSAALLFGELLSTIRLLLHAAVEARTRGDPYGPLTRRMLHAARREIDIYERNREALVDLRDPRLRSDMHNLTLRVALPLDGLLDSFTPGGDSDDERRGAAFDFMMANVERMPEMIARLGKLARHSFGNYEEILKQGIISG